MKKLLISIFVFFVPFLLIFFFAPKETYAQEQSCTGESTGLTGICRFTISKIYSYRCTPKPPYMFDGKSTCGNLYQCCVLTDESTPYPSKEKSGFWAAPKPFDLVGLEEEVYKEGVLSNFKFTGGSIGDIVSGLLFLLFPIAGILLLIYLIIGGIQLMLSAGDPKAIEAAKGKITNALIGFLIIFVAYWLVQIIGRILGIEAISNIF